MRSKVFLVTITLAIICILLFVAAISSRPEEIWFNLSLGVVSLILSVAASLVVSYGQMKLELEKENEKIVSRDRQRLADVTAKSASELNDLFHNIQTFEETWGHLVDRSQEIDDALAASISNTISNMKTIVQSTVNKIIYISSSEKTENIKNNPYGLYNFQDEVKCSTFPCDEILSCQSVPAYHRGGDVVHCKKCNYLSSVRRDFDGSLVSRRSELNTRSKYTFPRTFEPTMSVSSEKKHVDIVCPNIECRQKIHIEAPQFLQSVMRGCYECRVTFQFNMMNNEANIKRTSNSQDLTEDDFRDGSIICACGTINKHKGIIVNSSGIKRLLCHICGAMHEISGQLN